MKSVWLYTLFLCLTASSVRGQKAAIYAYKQKIIPGVAAKKEASAGSDDNYINYRYHIYVAIPNTSPAIPLSIWIKGKERQLNSEIVQTPVAMEEDPIYQPGQKKVLVPQTNQKVLRLIPGRQVTGKNSYPGQTAQTNELVVKMKCGKRVYFIEKESIVELAPVALP